MLLYALGLALLPLASGFYSLVAVAVLLGFANGIGTGVVMIIGADLARMSSQQGQFLGLWRLIGDRRHQPSAAARRSARRRRRPRRRELHRREHRLRGHARDGAARRRDAARRGPSAALTRILSPASRDAGRGLAPRMPFPGPSAHRDVRMSSPRDGLPACPGKGIRCASPPPRNLGRRQRASASAALCASGARLKLLGHANTYPLLSDARRQLEGLYFRREDLPADEARAIACWSPQWAPTRGRSTARAGRIRSRAKSRS